MLSNELQHLCSTLSEALQTGNDKLVHSTCLLVAEHLQEISVPRAQKLESDLAIIVAEDGGAARIVAIDQRGIIPHLGKVT